MKVQKRHIKPLVRRGNSIALHIPPDLLARLGWNPYDNLLMEPVDGALILTKVKLPNVEHLRRASTAERDGE